MEKKPAAYQVIRNSRILDFDSRNVETADILIKEDTIKEIGRSGMEAPADAVVVDAKNQLVIPGLVNAHTHGQGSLSKGLGDQWSLELLLNALPWVGHGITLEDKHIAALLNAAEMVLKGCTAAYDMYYEFPFPSIDGIAAIGNAYSEIGVRVVLAPMMSDTKLFDAIPGLFDALPKEHQQTVQKLRIATSDENINICKELLHQWPCDRLTVSPALGPTIPLHCSDGFIGACRDLAIEYDIGVHMHLAESKVQAVSGIKRYGKTLTRYLDDNGLIGPKFTGAHCIWLDRDDINLMRDKGASIAHNPGSNLRLGSGIAPVRQMIDSGINLGLGTDGSASADNQNIFEAMRMASFVSRLVTHDPAEFLGTWEILDMATSGSASVLGWGNTIGRIAPGYKADLVFLDLNNVNFVPLNNAANQLINCEDSSAVDSVMIGGRMVLSGRQFTEFDYKKLCGDAQSIADRLSLANKDVKATMDAMVPFVAQHCIGLACEPYHVHRKLDYRNEFS